MKRNEEELMRLFIAITLNDSMRDEAFRVGQAWQEDCPRGNFSRKENLHITLRFLGGVAPEKAGRIATAMEWAAMLSEPFSLRLNRPGAFVKDQEAVLWLGLAGDTEPLKHLHQALGQALEPLGFMPEGVYRPHLTIARQVKGIDPKEVCGHTLIKPVGMRVESIALMHSTRVDGLLTYLPLKRVKLGGA